MDASIGYQLKRCICRIMCIYIYACYVINIKRRRKGTWKLKLNLQYPSRTEVEEAKVAHNKKKVYLFWVSLKDPNQLWFSHVVGHN